MRNFSIMVCLLALFLTAEVIGADLLSEVEKQKLSNTYYRAVNGDKDAKKELEPGYLGDSFIEKQGNPGRITWYCNILEWRQYKGASGEMKKILNNQQEELEPYLKRLAITTITAVVGAGSIYAIPFVIRFLTNRR